MEQQIKTIKARLDLYRAFTHDGTQECQNANHRMYMDLLTRIRGALDKVADDLACSPADHASDLKFLESAHNEILSLYFLTSVGDAKA